MAPVNVENISPNSKIRLVTLKKLAQKILKDFREKGGVNIILVSDNYMRRLNQRFTKRKGSTDVLSFSFKENRTPKRNEEFLGEVYVSVDKAGKQAKSYKVSLNQELKKLVAHGILHLLGYDHRVGKDEELMRKKEEEYILPRNK
jgi:probable rRNA maturation factor